jgi:hypothetical protein
MAKLTGTNVTVTATDKIQIIFRSTGDQDLKLNEGTPAVATGNLKDKTATVHGTVPGSTVLIHNPA